MRTYDLLRALMACLLLRLETEGRPIIGNCTNIVLPGARIMRLGNGEQAWVRLRNASDQIVAGQQNVDPANCIHNLGWSIEIGVVRCMSLPRANKSPNPAVVDATTLAQLEDMESIRNALLCCGALTAGDWTFGNYTAIGPEGPDVGGFWVIEVVDSFWDED